MLNIIGIPKHYSKAKKVITSLILIFLFSQSAISDVTITPQWWALGNGFTNGYGNALVVYRDTLFVGGTFTFLCGVNVNYIAKWNGTSWIPIGSGMGASVRALTVYRGDLIAAGDFITANGVSANKIAKWNGNSWSSLGTGMNTGSVFDLAVYGDTLIAGGSFITAGGVTVNRIAKWNGSSWSAFGLGMNNNVHSLAFYMDSVIAGGDFTTAGGATVNKIAKWDGNSWYSMGNVGNPVTSRISELFVYGNTLIAGGYLSKFIAARTGNTWTPLSGGTNLYVIALTLYNGSLIAGGWFTNAGGVSANYIAKWNGSFAPLGIGMNGAVQALTVYRGELIACGQFTIAGGVSANVAKYSPYQPVIGPDNYSPGEVLTSLNNQEPPEYGISQNNPNPFNPTTIINFQIKEASDVTLKVYDVTGREIITLVNQRLSPGNYERDFDGSTLNSGIYFYKITAGNYEEIKKMILIK